MKKIALVIAIASAFTAVNVAQAAEVTAQALATWSATAKKDTTSKLVVTPLGSLNFQYAEGIKGFNTQQGLFDVTVQGDTTATAFKLTSKLISNTLTQLNNSGSTLDVGVKYNGVALTKAAETTMINTATNMPGHSLSALSEGYKTAGRTSAQDLFTFAIASATSDGTKPVTDFSTLPEGIWNGDVSVEFNATWTVPDAVIP